MPEVQLVNHHVSLEQVIESFVLCKASCKAQRFTDRMFRIDSLLQEIKETDPLPCCPKARVDRRTLPFRFAYKTAIPFLPPLTPQSSEKASSSRDKKNAGLART